MVAVDAVGCGGFGVAACSALVHEGHFDLVLLWVKHVGAFPTKLRPNILPHVVLLLCMALGVGARSVH